MLTDSGSIKTNEVDFEDAMVKYRKKYKILWLVMLIVGAAGLVAYFSLLVALEIIYKREFPWLDVMFIFAVPFALGLIFTVSIARIHKYELREEKVGACEFFADCFFCTVRASASFQTSPTQLKLNYSDGIYKCENEKYAYIYVPEKRYFLPFGKDGLSVAELNGIRKNFKQIIDGDAVELENYKEGGYSK